MFPNNLPATSFARQLLLRATAALMRTDLDTPQKVNPSVANNFVAFNDTAGALKDSGKGLTHLVYSLKWGIWINYTPPANNPQYFGDTQGAALSQGRSQIYFPMAGTVVAADCHFLVNTTLGTTETSSVNLRISNTTNYLITNAAKQDARVQRYLGTMSAVVTTSDYFEILWNTPASWATPPTGVRLYGNVMVQL